MSYFIKDKLSIKSNQILANLFAQLILLSEKVQSFRQILASVPYFDCIQLFRLLDRDQKGYLIQKDFVFIIGQSHKKVVTYVFSWFDQTKMGQISRLEFISFLIPRKNQDLREIVARRIEQPQIDLNSQITLKQQLRIFTELLTDMISHQLKIIEQRRLLINSDNYSIKGVLNSLDSNNFQWVSVTDIYKFLQNYAINASIPQIQSLLQIIDSKLQGRITQEQLIWIIEGLQGSKKQYLKRIKSANNKNNKNYASPQSIKNKKQFQSNQASNVKQKNSSKKKQVPRQNMVNLKNSQTQNVKTQQKKVKLTDNNEKFMKILDKFKQLQKQVEQKDKQLVQNQHQIALKLRHDYYKQSLAKSKKLEDIKYLESNHQRPFYNSGYLPNSRANIYPLTLNNPNILSDDKYKKLLLQSSETERYRKQIHKQKSFLQDQIKVKPFSYLNGYDSNKYGDSSQFKSKFAQNYSDQKSKLNNQQFQPIISRHQNNIKDSKFVHESVKKFQKSPPYWGLNKSNDIYNTQIKQIPYQNYINKTPIQQTLNSRTFYSKATQPTQIKNHYNSGLKRAY